MSWPGSTNWRDAGAEVNLGRDPRKRSDGAHVAQGFPPVRPGMCIGLLGGSFDPAHEGHATDQPRGAEAVRAGRGLVAGDRPAIP